MWLDIKWHTCELNGTGSQKYQNKEVYTSKRKMSSYKWVHVNAGGYKLSICGQFKHDWTVYPL